MGERSNDFDLRLQDSFHGWLFDGSQVDNFDGNGALIIFVDAFVDRTGKSFAQKVRFEELVILNIFFRLSFMQSHLFFRTSR